MIATNNGRVPINVNTGSFIWEMDVIGTHFPALSIASNFFSPLLQLESNKENKVTIDYGDGTGDHTYNFVLDSGVYKFAMNRRSNNQIGTAPTPANISQTGTIYSDVYFYQDLSLPDNTVDDLLNHHRTIKINIENFSALTSLIIDGVGIYGQIPSIINRLVSLDTLVMNDIRKMTGIDAEFSKVFSKKITFGKLGFSFGTKIPDFVINSDDLESVNIDSMVDLSSGSVSSRLYDFLENPAFLPNLNSFNLSTTKINYEMPNLRRVMTGTCALQDMPVDFGFSPDLSTYGFSSLIVNRGVFIHTEHKRILEDSSVSQYNMRKCSVPVDFDLTSNNTTLEILQISVSTFGGFLPSFISKLTNLKTLFSGLSTTNESSGYTGWGAAGFPSSIQELRITGETALPPSLPSWFSTLVNITDLTFDNWDTQLNMDAHVDSFYAMASITTDFDGLNYTLYGSVQVNKSIRPSGIYQAGTASTPMEKIWDLVNNHNMIITVTNATNDGKDIYTT